MSQKSIPISTKVVMYYIVGKKLEVIIKARRMDTLLKRYNASPLQGIGVIKVDEYGQHWHDKWFLKDCNKFTIKKVTYIEIGAH